MGESASRPVAQLFLGSYDGSTRYGTRTGASAAVPPALIDRVQGRLVNLTFHGIGDPVRRLENGEQAVWLSHARFLFVLDSVADRRDVHMTFDDGNKSDVEHALPALRERGLTASFFLVAGRLGEPGFVDAADVRALSRAGMTIGCHGMRHRPWRAMSERALREELVEARHALEEIVGRPVTEAACPFGSYDRRVLGSLRRCGYRTVYTSDGGTSRPQAWIQTRTTVRSGDAGSLIEQIMSSDRSPYRALRRRARWMVKRWR